MVDHLVVVVVMVEGTKICLYIVNTNVFMYILRLYLLFLFFSINRGGGRFGGRGGGGGRFGGGRGGGRGAGGGRGGGMKGGAKGE